MQSWGNPAAVLGWSWVDPAWMLGRFCGHPGLILGHSGLHQPTNPEGYLGRLPWGVILGGVLGGYLGGYHPRQSGLPQGIPYQSIPKQIQPAPTRPPLLLVDPTRPDLHCSSRTFPPWTGNNQDLPAPSVLCRPGLETTPRDKPWTRDSTLDSFSPWTGDSTVD